MLLEKIKFLTTKISYRLAFVYFSFFIPCFLLAFGFLFYLTSSYLKNKDRDVLEIRAQQIQEQYEKNELAGLTDLIEKLRTQDQIQRVLIRILDSKSQPIFNHTPEDTSKFELNKIDNAIASYMTIPQKPKWQTVMINDGEESMYELKVYKMRNGNILTVGESTDERDDLLEKFRNIFIIILIPVLVVCSVGAVFIAQKMLRPLKNITNSLAEISSGQLSSRVPVPQTQDELYELSLVYNKMGTHIEELIKALNETVDNIAHDLKTPISRARISAEIALKNNNCEELRNAVVYSLESSDSILLLIQSVLLMARYDSKSIKLNRTSFYLNDLIDEVINLYFFVAEEKSIILTREENDIYLNADRPLVKQCLANLVDNAIKYSHPDSKIRVVAKKENTNVLLSVLDSGVGIAKDEHERIWERLYRSDKSRHKPGMGLGLSMVKAIVQAHDGEVTVKSVVDVGSEFIISIPNRS